MQSGMQDDWPLVVHKIIEYAAKFHGNQQIISRSVEDPSQTHFCTYRDVRDRAALCALALRRLGIKPGDRVATLAWNTTRHMESWYAIPSGCGAVYHSLNPRLFDKELDYIINHAGDKIIMADISFIELLERLLPKLPTVEAIIFFTDRAHMPSTSSKLYQNSPKVKILCYEDLLHAEINGLSTFQWLECHENQACGLCYTSGTTGNPKGVLYSHRSNFLMAMSACLPDALDIKTSSTFLVCVPMFHANAWGIVFAAPFVGAKLILPGPYLDGENIHKMMQLHRATHTAGVPTLWAGLMDYLESPSKIKLTTSSSHSFPTNASFNEQANDGGKSKKKEITTLELMVVGGAQCPRHLMEYFENTWQVEVRHLWGMTELSPLGTMGTIKGTVLDRYNLRKNDNRNQKINGNTDTFGSGTTATSSSSSSHKKEEEVRMGYKLKQGWPLAFVDMRIVNDKNEELPWDGKQFGNLQVRGPHTLKTYFRGDPTKPATDAEGWFDTGDVATIDPEGYMAITDRAKDVIKSGGEWISSIEIENRAAGHPKVAEAAVIGISDQKWGERPLLVIVPREDNSSIDSKESLKSEILEYLTGKIAKWWIPDDVVFVEAIPHTATGKISKLQLRMQLKDHKIINSGNGGGGGGGGLSAQRRSKL
ncbi:hypothetical protein Ndes2526B_g00112 [Nannochloris sp. 'desiccata']|nr:putative Medium-chain-fatty-acid--CoA ligase [Chlorella desiccata (nom. nud.)]